MNSEQSAPEGSRRVGKRPEGIKFPCTTGAPTRGIMVVGMVGSAWAFALLLVMVSMPWPYPIAFPGDAVLTGEAALPRDQVAGLAQSVRFILGIDTAYILSWVAAWVGTSCFAARRSATFGRAGLIVGLSAPALDLLENQMILSLLLDHLHGASIDLDRLLNW